MKERHEGNEAHEEVHQGNERTEIRKGEKVFWLVFRLVSRLLSRGVSRLVSRAPKRAVLGPSWAPRGPFWDTCVFDCLSCFIPGQARDSQGPEKHTNIKVYFENVFVHG